MAKYLYNGIELPALPEWDKSTYPVAYIYKPRSDWTDCYLVLCSAFKYETYDGNYRIGKVAPYTQCHSNVSGDTWGEFSTVSETDAWIGKLGSDRIIWTNTDILNEDGTIYLAASEPVPVDTEGETTSTTPTNADYYIRKNGKWYKNKGGASSGTSGGGTGTELPTPTTDDNGKFLRVVDGAYALVALTDVSVEGA